MDGLILILYLMTFIGFVQVISAIIMLIATKQNNVRKHFAYYLGGVVLYFVLIFPMAEVSQNIGEAFGIAYFFTGALGLMLYHIRILFMWKPRPRY